ncbi:hypothetical protein BS78_07G105400 [Paspalum vaginatum]|nr:hypothetical protein BS78_07G105400 [Paspalum vaginatum]
MTPARPRSLSPTTAPTVSSAPMVVVVPNSSADLPPPRPWSSSFPAPAPTCLLRAHGGLSLASAPTAASTPVVAITDGGDARQIRATADERRRIWDTTDEGRRSRAAVIVGRRSWAAQLPELLYMASGVH